MTHTRPDLTYSAHSQFLDFPRKPHLDAAHHILRCIKATAGQCLLFPADSPLHLKAFSDSDWATCIDTRRSTTVLCLSR